jgi:hypothetical protein
VFRIVVPVGDASGSVPAVGGLPDALPEGKG